MNFLAISNFPSRFNEDKLLPAFKSRGVYKISFVDASEAKSLGYGSLCRYDQVFLFHDMIGHSDYYDIKAKLQKYGVPLKLLGRKTASWPDELITVKHEEKDIMPPAKSVNDNDVPNLCSDYAESYKLRETDKQRLDRCSKYWKVRPLTSSRQLEQYIYRLLQNKQCPKWFEVFYNVERRNYLSDASPEVQEREAPAEKAQALGVEEQTGHTDNRSGATVDDLKSWNALLEEENADLVTRLKVAKDEIVERDRMIDQLNATISNARMTRDTEKSKDAMWRVKEAVIATHRLVELEVMDPKEAFERIVKTLLQSGA